MTLAEPAAAPVDAARHALEMVETIPLPLIDPSPYQPRQVFADEPLAELAASLAAHGLQQPITVRWGPEQQRYELLAGERRLRAAQQLGWETIPALVRDVDDAGAGTRPATARASAARVRLRRHQLVRLHPQRRRQLPYRRRVRLDEALLRAIDRRLSDLGQPCQLALGVGLLLPDQPQPL